MGLIRFGARRPIGKNEGDTVSVHLKERYSTKRRRPRAVRPPACDRFACRVLPIGEPS
jgi:hypothetical protein